MHTEKKYLFFSLRPKQWIKNFFIFLPLIFGKSLFNLSVVLKAIAAFFLVSLAASAVYLFNDLMDYNNDRLHPIKRLRPLPSGKISFLAMGFTASLLTIVSLVLSFILDTYLGWVIITYLLANIIYTKILKKIVIIDVLCIGFFFLLRIIAGCIVAGVIVSHWIIFCTILLALFLGFNKRRHELKVLKGNAYAHRSVLAKYNFDFIDQMISIITASIVVVYMLYTVDATVVSTLGNNHLIYSIPFVYYGIFRYLYLVHKRGKGGDPTRILLRDWVLQLNLLLWIAVCIAVIYFKI